MNSTATGLLPRPGSPAGAVISTAAAPIVMMMQAEDRFIEPKLDVFDWVLTAIALVVVSLRVYSKFRRKAGLWWDDYVAIVSWTLLAALSITLTIEVHDGAGKHISSLDRETLRMFTLTDEIGLTIATVVNGLAKTGLAVALQRIATGWRRKAIWTVVFLVNAVSGVAGMLIWVQCEPLKKNFEPATVGSCFPNSVRVGVQIMNTSVSGATDIALALLALVVVRQHTLRQGYFVGSLVCALLGVVAGIAAFAKTALMHILAGDDLSFDSTTLIISTILEPSLLIIAGSLPELRDYVWKHPKPVRYRYDDFLNPRNGLSDADYEYARQQYSAAGGKALVLDTETQEQRMQGSVWESDDDSVEWRAQKKRIPFPRAPFV